MIGRRGADQPAAGRNPFLGAHLGVVERAARLRDLPLDNLEPGCQQALAFIVSTERVALVAALQRAYDHAIRDQLVQRFKIGPQTTNGRSH